MGRLATVGFTVGATVGLVVGAVVGLVVGAVVGAVVGFVVGAVVGLVVGAVVGLVVGAVVGAVVGIVVGAVVGLVVGAVVGLVVGAVVGIVVGAVVDAVVEVVSEAAVLSVLVVSAQAVAGTILSSIIIASSKLVTRFFTDMYSFQFLCPTIIADNACYCNLFFVIVTYLSPVLQEKSFIFCYFQEYISIFLHFLLPGTSLHNCLSNTFRIAFLIDICYD